MSAEVTFRRAERRDLPAILDLLADDEIARARKAHANRSATDDPAADTGRHPRSTATTATGAAAVRDGPGTARIAECDAVVAAFEAIDADPRNELVVADEDGEVVGTCQLTFIPGLSRGGAERMTIEAVRVRADRRGRGVGRQMMAYAIAIARGRDRGCGLAQLTTDKRRVDAHRFYGAMGFVASHEGMKLSL